MTRLMLLALTNAMIASWSAAEICTFVMRESVLVPPLPGAT